MVAAPRICGRLLIAILSLINHARQRLDAEIPLIPFLPRLIALRSARRSGTRSETRLKALAFCACGKGYCNAKGLFVEPAERPNSDAPDVDDRISAPLASGSNCQLASRRAVILEVAAVLFLIASPTLGYLGATLFWAGDNQKF